MTVKRHVFLCTVSFGDGRPEGELTEEQHRDLEALMDGIRRTLCSCGAEISKTLGGQILGTFAAPRAIIPALRACTGWLSGFATANRNDAHLQFVLHYGEVFEKDGDIFGENVGLAFRLATRSARRGVFLTAPAADALPEHDRAALIKREGSHGELHPNLASLLGRNETYELS